MSERRKEGDDWKDHAEFMNVVTFGKTAENAGQFLKKGRQVYVEGRIQTRQYKDKEGNDRYSTEVVANDVLFLGGGDGAGAGKSESRTPAASAGGGTKPAGDGFAGDDLPFITAATGVEP
jgi:single-strand DNA-binding protein